MVEVQNDHAETLITLTTDIVVSYVANNSVAADEVSALIQSVHGTLAGLGNGGAAAEVRPDPAVSIRSSVTVSALKTTGHPSTRACCVSLAPPRTGSICTRLAPASRCCGGVRSATATTPS